MCNNMSPETYVDEMLRIPAKDTRKWRALNANFRESLRERGKSYRYGRGEFAIENGLITYTLPG